MTSKPYSIKQDGDALLITPNCAEDVENHREAKKLRIMLLLSGFAQQGVGFGGVANSASSEASRIPVTVRNMTPETFDEYYARGQAVLQGLVDYGNQLGMEVVPTIRFSATDNAVYPVLNVLHTPGRDNDRNSPQQRFVLTMNLQGIEASVRTKREDRTIDFYPKGRDFLTKLDEALKAALPEEPIILHMRPHAEKHQKRDPLERGEGGERS